MASRKVDLTEHMDFADNVVSDFIPSKELRMKFYNDEPISNTEWGIMFAYNNVFGIRLHKSMKYDLLGLPKDKMENTKVCMYCGKLIRAPWEYTGNGCCINCYRNGEPMKNQRLTSSSNDNTKRVFNLR